MKKKKTLVLTIVLLGIVVCAVVLAIIMGGTDDAKRDVPPIEIQTSYAALQFPGTYANNLKHTETIENGITIESFSMIAGGMETELFHISFGDTQDGTVVGYMNLDSGVVPVVVSVFNADVDEFENEEIREQYYSMMDGLNTALSSIYEDKRFISDVHESQVENEVQMTYWTFNLPANMVCEESAESGAYKVTFSFNAGDVQHLMYTLYMGDGTRGSPFGNYQIGEEQKVLSIEISEFVQQEDLPEDVKNNVFALMDTINYVMDVITSDEHYSVLEAEE